MTHFDQARLETAVCDWLLPKLLSGEIDLPAGQAGESVLEQVEVA